MSKLPQMAKQLEVSLYRDAQSFEEYMDMLTLKQRLQQIAVEVSRKTRGQSDNTDRNRQSFQDRHPPPPQPPPPQQQQQAYQRRADPGSSYMQNPNPSVNRMDPNGMMLSNHSQNGHAMPPGNGYPDQRVASGSSRGVSRISRDDPEMRVRIRHKQQRLLLLHHSAKCPHEDGRCTVTPHCADMKRLWRHMEGCKDNQCSVPHCFSSRAIFRHYRKCREANCPACGPVRAGSSSLRTGTSTGPMINSLTNAMDQRASGLSEDEMKKNQDERKQRQRKLVMHIQLIKHASRCKSKQCTSTNCQKMKCFLMHEASCRVNVQGGCEICKRIWTLLRIHAQTCKDPKCPTPQCSAIRGKC